MNIEELRMVVDLVRDIAGGGAYAFAAWLVAAYVLPYAVGVLTITLIYRVASKIIQSIASNSAHMIWFENKAKEYRIPYSSPFWPTDASRVIVEIDERLKDKETK